jgi:hypothetical protein
MHQRPAYLGIDPLVRLAHGKETEMGGHLLAAQRDLRIIL